MDADLVPKRSPWRRRILFAALGLLVLVVAAVALAPSVAGSMLPGAVDQAFAERFHGRLELGDLDLGWGGRQHVDDALLFDPEGREVARADVELPGLWALITGGGREIGHIRVVASAAIEVDASGRSNLERALEPRAPPADTPPEEGGAGDGALEGRSFDVELVVERLTFTDPRAGAPFVLEDFTAHARLDGQGGAELDGAGRIQGGAEDGLKVAANAQRLFAAASAPEPPTVELDATLRDLPVALVDALAGQGGLLRDVLGESATLTVHASGTPRAGSANLSLTAERARIVAAGEIEGGVLRAREGNALEAELRLTSEAWAARVAPLLPPDVSVAPAGGDWILRATVSQLALPVAALVDASAAGEDVVARAAGEIELALEVRAGDLSVSAPTLSQPLALQDLSLLARLAPAEGKRRLEAELRAGVAGGETGSIALDLAAADTVALLAAAGGGAASPIVVRVELAGIDSALVKAQLGEGPTAELFGERFDLTLGIDGTLALAGASKAHTTLALATRGERLELELDVELPEGPAAAPITARGELKGLAFVRPLVPETWREAVDEALGGTLALELATRRSDDEAFDVDGSLSSERTRAAFALTQAPSGLSTRGERGIELTLRPSNETLARQLAASLPAGASVEFLEDGAAVELVVRELHWPSVEPAAADGTALAGTYAPAADADATAAALERARLNLELALPGLRIVSPGATKDATPVPVELAGLRAQAWLAPDSGLALTATSRLAEADQDTLDLRLEVPRPAEWLAEDTSAAAFTLALSCRALPTALVDALAAQDGLVVDVLGATVDVQLDARRPGGEQGLVLALRSPTASLDLTGSLEEGMLRSRETGALSATMPLTPLYTQRIVGNLLPMLVGLAKAPDSPPSVLAVRNFVLPFDGNLRKLDADVRLDLNQVSYRALPGLSEELASAIGAAAGIKSFDVAPLEIAVRQGVVRYDDLPITFQDRAVPFAGTFDLVTREFDLSTELPLALLGDKVLAELSSARLGLDPDMLVPLRISGTPTKPRLSVPREFAQKLLENAAKDAAKKGLGDLFERALKKDG
jgi:hypothetical protein